MRTTLDAARSIKRYLALGLGPEWEVRLNAEEGAYQRPFCRIDLVGSTTFQNAGPNGSPSELDLTVALILYPEASESPDESLLKAIECEELIFQMTNVGVAYLSAPTSLTAVKSSGGTLTGSHRYVVCAVNRYGKTLPSGAASVTGVNGKVTLTWEAIPDAVVYQVFRGTAGSERFLASTATASYVDNGSVSVTADTTLPTENTAKISGPMRIPLYDYSGVGIAEGVTDAARPEGSFMRITEPPSVSRMVDQYDENSWAVAANIRLSWRRSGVVPSDAPLITSFTTSEEAA